jgi:2-oxoglutarate ferredoxin oxidoreductase subunit alpha
LQEKGWRIGMMSEKRFMAGNEVIAEAAIQAGCKYYFGYPITPQNEIGEYMAWRLPQVGGCYLQAESEVAAIYMVFGAAGAGARVMTSSSSPGISLMQEGISYIAAAELPCVIVNMMRGGPGLGGIHPSQSDYFQATKGGGHGDYHLLVLGPSTAQEALNLTMLAFDLADKYRNPVMILGDGNMGQMMESVEFSVAEKPGLVSKDWAISGAKGRARNIVKTLYLDPAVLEERNLKMAEKMAVAVKNEVRYESYLTDDADVVIAAYGTVARIAKTAIQILREKGVKVGLLRPISLYPFPYQAFSDVADRVKDILVVEMSMGQMVEDVRLAVCDRSRIHFYSRVGGIVPSFGEITAEVEKIMRRAK